MLKDTAKTIINEARQCGDELHIDLWYPDVPSSDIKKMVLGLIDIRATDNIRISYDKSRDGWKIEQASTFEWEVDDEECDPGWQEAAFIQAWARETDNQ